MVFFDFPYFTKFIEPAVRIIIFNFRAEQLRIILFSFWFSIVLYIQYCSIVFTTIQLKPYQDNYIDVISSPVKTIIFKTNL